MKAWQNETGTSYPAVLAFAYKTLSEPLGQSQVLSPQILSSFETSFTGIVEVPHISHMVYKAWPASQSLFFFSPPHLQ